MLISSLSSSTSSTTSTPPISTWAFSWADIVNGGHPRWRVTDAVAHEAAMSVLRKLVRPGGHVYCPLAGDDPLIWKMWKEGYRVTAIDFVDTAVEALKARFDVEWERQELPDGTIMFSTERATVYLGDALEPRPELEGSVDGVYDKEGFGSLRPSMRTPYCDRLAEYCKDGVPVYLEAKVRDKHEQLKDFGPPFSLSTEDLEEHYDPKSFEHVEDLGPIYSIDMPGLQQRAHILRRKWRGT